MADMTTQAHNTRVLLGPEGEPVLVKPQKPDSYEFRNEVRWLGDMASKSFDNFTTPRLVDADPITGIVEMEFIDGEPADEDSRDEVYRALQELHTHIDSDVAVTRFGPIGVDEFALYLASTVTARATQMEREGIRVSPALINDARLSVAGLYCDRFVANHKDARYRHTIRRTDGQPLALIDWEYAHVGHPGQDLAKLAYDRRDQAVRNGVEGVKLGYVIEDTIAQYAKAGGHPAYSDDAMYEAVSGLYPLAPIERTKSLLNRKPTGYQAEIERDFALIEEWLSHDFAI